MFQRYKRARLYEPREAIWALSRYSVPLAVSANERQERLSWKAVTRQSRPGAAERSKSRRANSLMSNFANRLVKWRLA